VGFIESVQGAAFPDEDIFCALGPPEGFGRVVVPGEIFIYRGFQIFDTLIAVASRAPDSDLGEE